MVALAVATAIYIARVLNDAYLRRSDLQFSLDLFAHLVQSTVAVRANAFMLG